MANGTVAHFGEYAMASLRAMAQLDEPFTLTHPDGFSWWPGERPIRFGWRAPEPAHSLPTWRLWAEVEALHDIDAASPALDPFLIGLGRVMNQFTTTVQNNTLKFRSMAVALSDRDPAPLLQLLYRGALMLHIAERALPDSTRITRPKGLFGFGRSKPGHHPTAGRRRQPATELQAFFDAAVARGSGPTPPQQAPDMSMAMGALRASGYPLIAANHQDSNPRDIDGFNVVIETSHATALLELSLNQPNPAVGNGLLVVLRVRFPDGHLHGDGARIMHDLNAAEWQANTPLQLQGAWTTNVAGADVAHSAFYPNLLHHRALARDLALDGVRRIRWIFDHYGYHEPFTPRGPHGNMLLGSNEATGMRA